MKIMLNSSKESFSATNFPTSTADESPCRVTKTKSQSIFLGRLFRKKMQPLNEEMPELKCLVIGKADVGKSLFISKLIVEYYYFNDLFDTLFVLNSSRNLSICYAIGPKKFKIFDSISLKYV